LPTHAHRLEAVVSSSERTTRALESLGIEVVPLAAVRSIDLYVDGADEATRRKHLIKGGGGALTREKILAAASRSFVCIVDRSKLVDGLGAFPLPIEIVPMARSFVANRIVQVGGEPVWRKDFVTDNGNEILDVHNLRIDDPCGMETRLNQIPGIVTVGLFALRGADLLLVGEEDGVAEF
jgi:ribose 5-phosphate isomerase A